MKWHPLIKFLLCLSTLAIIIAGYYFIPVNVRLTRIAEATTDNVFQGAWWTMATKDTSLSFTQRYINDYNVILPDVDYDKNNLIISVGREMVSLKYRRFSRYQLTYSSKPYIGMVLFSKDMNPQTIYFYEIRKVNIIADEIVWPRIEESGIRGGVSMGRTYRADLRMEQIIRAIKNHDREGFESLFSTKALSEAIDFQNDIDLFFSFIQGDVIFWERTGFSSSESRRYGRNTFMNRFLVNMRTDMDDYVLYVIDYYIDSINPDNEGIYMLQIRTSGYNGYNEDLESWQEIMRAGFYIPELHQEHESND